MLPGCPAVARARAEIAIDPIDSHRLHIMLMINCNSHIHVCFYKRIHKTNERAPTHPQHNGGEDAENHQRHRLLQHLDLRRVERPAIVAVAQSHGGNLR